MKSSCRLPGIFRGSGGLGEIPRDEGKGYLNCFSLHRQMALLQANKDLISTGMKEFNVLLNQQVNQAFYSKGQAWGGGWW